MIYFDNAATTKPCKQAVEAVTHCMEHNFGNPSSLHTLGVQSSRTLKNVRNAICEYFGARECIFTSGGTEANNLALFGASNTKIGRKIITTATEHTSILQPCKQLERRGFEVIYLGVDAYGRISLEQLEMALSRDVSLVSIMHVNNELGTVNPISDISKMVRKYAPRGIFHVDAVQGFGKLTFEYSCADLITISGHKVHAPKGIGALIVMNKNSLTPLLFGGGQEKNVRSGTENVYGIAGLGAAMEMFQLERNFGDVAQMRNSLIAGLAGLDFHVNSPDDASPYIVNISFVGCKAEILLNALSERGVMVSAGAACNGQNVSHVLRSANNKYAQSALRFSFSPHNSIREVEQVVNVLHDLNREGILWKMK